MKYSIKIKSFICPTNARINYSKTVELLKTFKTTIIVPRCFGLHKPSPGTSQSVLRQSYNIDFSVYMSLMKFLVSCRIEFCTVYDTHTGMEQNMHRIPFCTVHNVHVQRDGTKCAATAPKTSLTTVYTEINIVTLVKHRLCVP